MKAAARLHGTTSGQLSGHMPDELDCVYWCRTLDHMHPTQSSLSLSTQKIAEKATTLTL